MPDYLGPCVRLATILSAVLISTSALAQNNAPVMDFVYDQPIFFDGVMAMRDIVVTATDVDGDTLTFTESGRPPYCGFMQTSNTSFLLQCDHLQDPMDPTPPPQDPFPTTVTVIDNGSPAMQDSQTFNIYLTGIRYEAPVLAQISNQLVGVNAQLIVDLSATDASQNTLTYSAANLPGFCSLNDKGDKTGDITCDPLPGDEDSYTVTVTVTDDGTPWVPGTNPELLSDTQDFDIVVGGNNTAPVLDPIGDRVLTICCSPLVIDITASDPDNDMLTITSTPLPSECDPFNDNGDGTASISCVINDPMIGLNFEATVTVTDDGTPTLSDSETFTVTSNFEIPDEIPQADAGMDRPILTGQRSRLDGDGFDFESGENVLYDWQLISAPTGSATNSLSISDPSLESPTFTPDVDGVYEFELTVTDEENQSASDSVLVTAGTDPLLYSISANQLRQLDSFNGSTYMTVTVTINGDTINDGNALAADYYGGPLFGAFEINGQVGSELVTIDATSGETVRVGNLGDFVSALTFHTDGTLYAVTADIAAAPQTLYSVDLNTATMTFLYTLGSDGGTPTEGDVIAYNPVDGLLYRTARLGAFGIPPLFESIDLGTGVATRITYTGIGTGEFEVTGLAFDLDIGRFKAVFGGLSASNNFIWLTDAGAVLSAGIVPEMRGLTFRHALPSTFGDVTTFEDVSGDSIPDVAGFVGDFAARPGIAIYSGANGDVHSTIDFINDKWRGVALGTVRDANQDGTADDPAVAMLVVNKTTNKVRVETRALSNGAFLGSIQFFNGNWRAVDVVVVDDSNGDGNTNDTAIAILAERISDGRIQLQLRDYVSGALISNVVYLNARWTPIAAAVADRSAMAPAGTLPPLIGVIAEKAEDGRRVLQSRVTGAGTFDRNIKFLGSAWNYHDVSVNHDANGDGTFDDPIWLVLATRPADNVIRVQSKFVADGSFDDNIVILNSNWEAIRLDAANDISGNLSGEMAISAIRRADGVRRIHIKDYGTSSTTINIAP